MDFIRDNAAVLARAKAERVYLEEFRKSLKAILMKQSDETSAIAQERDAYASERYLELLTGLKVAVAEEERLRWQMVAAQARIEVWRSMESSARMMDRSTK